MGWLARLAEVARRTEVPLVAAGAVHYHEPARRTLQALLVCIRSGCTLDEVNTSMARRASRAPPR